MCLDLSFMSGLLTIGVSSAHTLKKKVTRKPEKKDAFLKKYFGPFHGGNVSFKSSREAPPKIQKASVSNSFRVKQKIKPSQVRMPGLHCHRSNTVNKLRMSGLHK